MCLICVVNLTDVLSWSKHTYCTLPKVDLTRTFRKTYCRSPFPASYSQCLQ